MNLRGRDADLRPGAGWKASGERLGSGMPSALHERLHAVAGQLTYRRLGELTNTHPETVRRYMQGQAPSAEFLAGVCVNLAVSGEWILTGRGPMRSGDVRAHALREANAADLLGAVAATLEKLHERVERLEVFAQSLETRVRGLAAVAAAGSAGVGVGERSAGPGFAEHHATGAGLGPAAGGVSSGSVAVGGPGAAGDTGLGSSPGGSMNSDDHARRSQPPATPDWRARSVADVVAQRPRPHAD